MGEGSRIRLTLNRCSGSLNSNTEAQRFVCFEDKGSRLRPSWKHFIPTLVLGKGSNKGAQGLQPTTEERNIAKMNTFTIRI